MLFDRFSDEADFRSTFVRPLLTRMGFIAVAEQHGQQEFGKDFVFSELTPFGFVRHYAAVVKHERKINQTATVLCNTLLAQVRQAFSVEFQLPDAEPAHRVSSVVVFNSGSITDNARLWIRAELDEERYGRNVHVLDGERLFQLDLGTSFRQGEQLLPRLEGIKSDIFLNGKVWANILENLPSFPEARGQFTSALEGFLAAPFLTDHIAVSDVAILLQQSRIIDCINDRYLRGSPMTNRENDVETLKKIIVAAKGTATAILSQIKRAEGCFGLLSTDSPPGK